MTIRLSKDSRTQACNAIVDNIDSVIPTPASPNIGILQFLQGPRPSVVDSPPTGSVLLAQVQFSNTTAFGAALDGVANSNGLDPGTIIRNGTAQWFRVLDRSQSGTPGHAVVNGQNRQIVWDGEITGVGGGGDIEFDNVVFNAGGTVVINSFLATMPEECP